MRQHVRLFHFSPWVLLTALLIIVGSAGRAQTEDSELRVRPQLDNALEIRVVWEGTTTAAAVINIGNGRRVRIDTTREVTSTPPARPLIQSLGLSNCGITPRAEPSNAQVWGTDILIYAEASQPYAAAENWDFRDDRRTRSLLVWSDRPVRITGQGLCSSNSYGGTEVDLNLRRGWNWITLETRERIRNNEGREQLERSTSVRVASNPRGRFEMRPLPDSLLNRP